MKKLKLDLKMKDLWWKSKFSDDEIPLVENLVKEITVKEIHITEACFSTYTVFIKIEDNSNKIFKNKILDFPLFDFPDVNKLSDIVLCETTGYVKNKLKNNIFNYKRDLVYHEFLRRSGNAS